MTLFIGIVGLLIATGAVWIGYRALVLAHEAQHAALAQQEGADARERLESIQRLLEQLRRLEDAQAAPDDRGFRDIQAGMRAGLALGGLRKRLLVTTILSERAFDPDAAGGRPHREDFGRTCDAARAELYAAAGDAAEHARVTRSRWARGT